MSQSNSKPEVYLTSHHRELWIRRREERKQWNTAPKIIRKKKEVVSFLDEDVDRELYDTLCLLNDFGIETEYSCAGVSLLDDPLHHSLYAYITLKKDSLAEAFIQYVISRGRHRFLITYEQPRNRYDISSFFIGHNRSYCFLLYHYTKQFIALH